MEAPFGARCCIRRRFGGERIDQRAGFFKIDRWADYRVIGKCFDPPAQAIEVACHLVVPIGVVHADPRIEPLIFGHASARHAARQKTALAIARKLLGRDRDAEFDERPVLRDIAQSQSKDLRVSQRQFAGCAAVSVSLLQPFGTGADHFSSGCDTL